MKKKIQLIITFCLAILLLVGCGSSASNKLTAKDYADKLKGMGLAIENLEVYTSENDPNKLLGRPNQYISKANFTNGSIEVFKSKEDATNRKEYIDSIGKKMNTVVEYSYINGTTLLRVNKEVTPDEAKKYEEAFNKIKD